MDAEKRKPDPWKLLMPWQPPTWESFRGYPYLGLLLLLCIYIDRGIRGNLSPLVLAESEHSDAWSLVLLKDKLFIRKVVLAKDQILEESALHSKVSNGLQSPCSVRARLARACPYSLVYVMQSQKKSRVSFHHIPLCFLLQTSVWLLPQ